MLIIPDIRRHSDIPRLFGTSDEDRPSRAQYLSAPPAELPA